MNIDERLEALTQTVELLALMHKDHEARPAQSLEVLVSMHKDNEARVAQVMDTMTRMGRIIEKHDLDIDLHEGRLNDIEGRPHA